MWAVKRLIVVGIIASLVHFSDNAFEIGHYPEPSWITPNIVLVSWIPVAVLATAALLRKNGDPVFVMLSAILAVLSLTGLAHYLYGSPMRMYGLSDFTIAFEALSGVALLGALFWSLSGKKVGRT
ncbi:MAG TPA: hypothetical protein VID24_02300 [Candidatus Eremiobacteraceae bacterium]